LLTKKTAVQTSRQMTARLLCRDCEQRFSKFGENWVLAHCLHKDRSFLLAAILASRTPDISSDKTTTRLFYAAKIPEIDISALAYFATSIFWRGSIHPWNDGGSIPVMLGPFQEQFRQYLLGLLPFPKDCSLSVVVREGKEIDRLSSAASAIGRAARCSDNLRLDLSPQEALYLRSKCAYSEDRQTDGLCVCRSIPSQF